MRNTILVGMMGCLALLHLLQGQIGVAIMVAVCGGGVLVRFGRTVERMALLLVLPLLSVVCLLLSSGQAMMVMTLATCTFMALALAPSFREHYSNAVSTAVLVISTIPFYFSMAQYQVLVQIIGALLLFLAWLQAYPQLLTHRKRWLSGAASIMLGILGVSLLFSPVGAGATVRAVEYYEEEIAPLLYAGAKRGGARPRGPSQQSFGLQAPGEDGEKRFVAFVQMMGNRPSRKPVYLKESCYGVFNGRMWFSLKRGVRTLNDPDDGMRDGWIRLGDPYAEDISRYRVYLAQSRSRLALAMPGVAAIGTPTLISRGEHQYAFPQSGFENISYPALSGMVRISDLANERLEIGEVADGYTLLPRTPLVERIKRDTRRLVSAKAPVQDRIKRILEHCHQDYKYKRLPKHVPGKNLENFLYVTRRGHCSLFATSCALMLRSVDVPSRLVVGYLSQTWDPVNKVHMVSSRDRHAWVEVHLAEHGWVTIDPTPSSGRPRMARVRSDFAEVRSNYADLGNRPAPTVKRRERTFITVAMEKLSRNGVYFLAFIMLVLLAVYRLLREVRSRAVPSDVRVRVPTRFFDLFCKHFASLGVPRRVGQTPYEYLADLQSRKLVNGEFDDLIAYYYAIKYEGGTPSQEKEIGFVKKVRALKRRVASDAGDRE